MPSGKPGHGRLTYANVVATLALFVALGGSAYAGLRVTGRDIVNHSLTGKDIRLGSLTGRHVGNRSLSARDFRRRSLPRGLEGPRGEKGEKGDKGDAATGGFTQLTVREGGLSAGDPPPTGPHTQAGIALCDGGRGERAVSGGFFTPREDSYAVYDRPFVRAGATDPLGWEVGIRNQTGPPPAPPNQARVYVVCAAP